MDSKFSMDQSSASITQDPNSSGDEIDHIHSRVNGAKHRPTNNGANLHGVEYSGSGSKNSDFEEQRRSSGRELVDEDEDERLKNLRRKLEIEQDVRRGMYIKLNYARFTMIRRNLFKRWSK